MNPKKLLILLIVLLLTVYIAWQTKRTWEGSQWRYDTREDNEPEHICDLVQHGDLCEIARRFESHDHSETTATLSMRIHDAITHRNDLTAIYLMGHLYGAPDALDEFIGDPTGRALSLMAELRDKDRITVEEVFVLKKWLESKPPGELIPTVSEAKSLLGSDSTTPNRDEPTDSIQYTLAGWCEEGGGSGGGYVRRVVYTLILQVTPESDTIESVQIERSRRIDIDYDTTF